MAQPIRMIDAANITEIFKQANDERNAFDLLVVYFNHRKNGGTPEQALNRVTSVPKVTTPPPPLASGRKQIETGLPPLKLDQPAKTTKTIPPRIMLT